MTKNLVTGLKCNYCGTNVDIDFDNLISFCPYCGAKLMMDVPSIQALLIEKEKTKQIQIQAEQTTAQKKMEYDAEYQDYDRIIENSKNESSSILRANIILGIFIILLIIVKLIKDGPK